MIVNAIRGRLGREPFEPFQIRTSSGQPYVVASPDLVVLLKSEVFVAAPDRDHAATIPYLRITAVESVSNGRGRHKGRRRRR
jgi:hypothetical protein